MKFRIVEKKKKIIDISTFSSLSLANHTHTKKKKKKVNIYYRIVSSTS